MPTSANDSPDYTTDGANFLSPLPDTENINPFGRALNASSRKRLVLDAAAQLFERHGYHGTSMQDIASDVGITKSALYHYVESKEQLVYEIHDAFVSTMIQEADEFLLSTPDPVDQLKLIVASTFRTIANYRPYVRAFFQDMHNLEGAEWYSRVVEKRRYYEGIVADCLQRGQEQGRFEFEVGPLFASRFLFGACNWAYQWLDPAGEVSPEELAEQWSVMLLKGFAPVSDRPDGSDPT